MAETVTNPEMHATYNLLVSKMLIDIKPNFITTCSEHNNDMKGRKNFPKNCLKRNKTKTEGKFLMVFTVIRDYKISVRTTGGVYQTQTKY